MFARSVSLRLNRKTLSEFIETFQRYVLPLIQKQPGFHGAIVLATEDGGHVNAISVWDSKEQAEKHDRCAYYLNKLEQVLSGTPKVRVSTVIISTSHRIPSAPETEPLPDGS